jgi:hypothetical protein
MLKKISFSGIDNHTDIGELKKLQNDYPIVEFGVLIYPKITEKEHRFLDTEMLRYYEGAGLNLSLHVCSELADRVMETGDWSEVKDFIHERLGLFDRIQVNVARRIKKYDKWILEIPEEVEEVIIQQAGVEKMHVYEVFLNEIASGLTCKRV